jgi:hypothetical protein
MRAVERLAGRGLAMRLGMRLGRLGVGRLEPEAARHLDRAQQDLQHMQRAAGLEAVGMGRDAAHGVQATGRPTNRSWRSPRKSVQGWSISIASSKATRGEFGGDGADRSRRDAAALGHRLGRVVRVEIALGHQLQDRRWVIAHRRRWAGQIGRTPGVVKGRSLPVRGRSPAACRPRRAAKPVFGAEAGRGSPAPARWCSARGSRGRSCPPSAGSGSATG